jgi:hypothetical protein
MILLGKSFEKTAQDTDLSRYVGVQLRNKVSLLDKLNRSVPNLRLFDMSLLPQDCLSIGYFLASLSINCKGRFLVDLSYCSLSDIGIKILMQSLCRSLDPHSEITGHFDIYIGGNEITGVGTSYVAEALRTTRTLRKLNLVRNPMGDKGLQYIVEAITTNTTLTELILRNCYLQITDANGPALTEMLRRNNTLTVLDLSFNEAISDNAALVIVEGLKKNITLKEMDLSYCGITDEGFRLIQSSTSTCKIRYKDKGYGVYQEYVCRAESGSMTLCSKSNSFRVGVHTQC